MDIKDLNKSQLIMLAVLLSFITSIATGITTVTLMQQAPASVTVPVTRIVRETVEKIVPVEIGAKTQALSAEDKKLLADLKAIKPLTVTLFLKGLPAQSGETESQDKVLGTGLFLGDNRVIMGSIIPEPKEGELYVVKSVLGEQKVFKVITEKDFTIIELTKSESETLPEADPGTEDSNTEGSPTS
jgi:hypothetical protein